MSWRPLVLCLFAVFISSGVLTAAPTPSEDITAALVEASKAMQKGGYAKAIEIIDETLKGGQPVQSDLASKALLIRAEANEKLGRNANAFSDYNSALWMQGLSAADRKRADEGYTRVAKALGISAPKPGSDQPAPGAAVQPTRQASAGTAVQEKPSEERTGSTGGIGGFFKNLFGQSSSEGSAPPRQEPPATAAVAVTAPSQPAEKQRPESKAKKPPAAAQRQAATAQPAPAITGSVKPQGSGNFAIQLAAVAEEDKAIAEADRIQKRYGADLEGRKPSLVIVPTADGGTLYKIILAGFDSRVEGLASCDQLKQKGLSCMVIVNKK